jgi:spermidine/putrescine transport system permease protein
VTDAAALRPPSRAPASPATGLSALLQRSEAARGYALLSPALLTMAAGVLIPFVILVVMSFWRPAGFGFDTDATLANYRAVVERPIYGALLMRSIWIALAATLVTVALCYPIAYFVAFHVRRNKILWLILLTLPFWTSYLLRVFAWRVVLGFEGLINTSLIGLGLIERPLEFLLYSPTAVVVTLIHAWAPFAILPIYVSLEKIDRSLLEAATDLGDGPAARFLRVTLPLSAPGVIAAMLLIFIPTVGDYITPALLGGPDGMMIGNLVQLQFGRANDWPMGAALAIVMMLAIAAVFLATRLLLGLLRRRLT